MSRAARACSALLLFTGCGSSAEESFEVGGHEVEVAVVHQRELGIGAFGAPHAFGIIYPTIEDHGLVVTMTVDDRPPVQAARLVEGEPEELIERVEVAGSEDGHHVAVRLAPDPWIVFHLLARGPPFDVPGSTEAGDEVDFARFGEPRSLAISALRSEAPLRDGPLWDAVTAMEDDELDLAIASHWPEERICREYLRDRAAASPALREPIGERALASIEAALGEAEGPRSSASADETAAAFLRSHGTSAHQARYHAMMLDAVREAELTIAPPLGTYLWRRAGPDPERPHARRPEVERRPSDAQVATEALRLVRARLAAPARRNFSARTLCLWVANAGTDEERAALHDTILDTWPSGALGNVDDALLESTAAGAFGETSDAWRGRAIDEASDATSSFSTAHAILRALEAPPPRLEPVIRRLFDAADPSLAEIPPDEGTREAFKRRVVRDCRRLGQTTPGQRAFCRAHAVWLLEQATESPDDECDAVRELYADAPRPASFEQLCDAPPEASAPEEPH